MPYRTRAEVALAAMRQILEACHHVYFPADGGITELSTAVCGECKQKALANDIGLRELTRWQAAERVVKALNDEPCRGLPTSVCEALEAYNEMKR